MSENGRSLVRAETRSVANVRALRISAYQNLAELVNDEVAFDPDPEPELLAEESEREYYVGVLKEIEEKYPEILVEFINRHSKFFAEFLDGRGAGGGRR